MKKIYASMLLGGAIVMGAVGANAATAAAAGSLAARWAALRAEQPKLQIRDAARTLGTSEAELLATGIGKTVTRLSDADHAVNDIMMRVRAYENGVWLAFVHPKRCLIIDPKGTVIAKDRGEFDQAVMATILMPSKCCSNVGARNFMGIWCIRRFT